MTKIGSVAVALIAIAAAPASAKPAAKFLKDAIQGDRSEMTLGSVIRYRGESSLVRTYGATLMRDHSAAHRQASSLAQRMHVRVSDTMMREARAEQSKLHRLRGKAFDREVRRYMIEDHHKDISEFKEQAKHGDRQTAALARQTLPVLEKHLSMAEALPR